MTCGLLVRCPVEISLPINELHVAATPSATNLRLGSLRRTEGFPLKRFSASGHEWPSSLSLRERQ
jgi:hypothetical protein